VYEQYDSMVQTNTVQGPGGEAGVMRIKGTNRGLAMALDGNGRWCYLDPRWGAALAVAEAARKVACTGATPVAATNCLNFGNPEKPEIMAQFSAAIDGIAHACKELGTPITGGNVSLYNETKGDGIYPTPVIGIVGILDDISKAVPSTFQRAGDAVLLIQSNYDHLDHHRLQSFGSSEYAKENLGSLWGSVPVLDLGDEYELQKALIDLANRGLIRSAKDVSDGGLAVALAEAGFPNDLGIVVNRINREGQSFPYRALAYFEETASTIVVSCDPADREAVETAVNRDSGLFCEYLGETVSGKLDLRIDNEPVVFAEIGELAKSWSASLEAQLAEEVTA
jgi:phosphoribosylformylglycinamidine synthase